MFKYFAHFKFDYLLVIELYTHTDTHTHTHTDDDFSKVISRRQMAACFTEVIGLVQ